VTATHAAITRLATYPIKSCRGIWSQEAVLGGTGFRDDRHWMLVRPTGRFVTQRELPRMALIEARADAASLFVDAPGTSPLIVSRQASGAARAVTVWKFDGSGIDCGEEAAAWFSRVLETELRLVVFNRDVPRECDRHWTGATSAVTEFSDGFPILVISEASLADLNSRLPRALPMQRFRPNVVIEGVQPYDEDRIHELVAGDVTLRLVKPFTRCAITTTDQDTGARDGDEPLRTLKSYRFSSELRGVLFGQNAIIVAGNGQRLRVGERFEIRWK
jgi:uncharacterized protein YcbX